MVIAANPTRFPSGINTTRSGMLRNMPENTGPNFYRYWNDFEHFNGTSGDDWTVTVVDTGTDSAQVISVGDEEYGALISTTNDADNDSNAVMTKGEIISFELGKRLWFETRMKISEATQVDWFIGLHVKDTTPFTTTDRVVWKKDDDDTQLDFSVLDNSVEGGVTSVSVATVSYRTYGFYWDGVDSMEYWLDGSRRGARTGTPGSGIPDGELCLGFGIQNGSAAVRTQTIDYILIGKDR